MQYVLVPHTALTWALIPWEACRPTVAGWVWPAGVCLVSAMRAFQWMWGCSGREHAFHFATDVSLLNIPWKASECSCYLCSTASCIEEYFAHCGSGSSAQVPNLWGCCRCSHRCAGALTRGSEHSAEPLRSGVAALGGLWIPAELTSLPVFFFVC